MSVSAKSPATASSISSIAAEVVRSLVAHPDQVTAEVSGSGREAVLLLTVHHNDIEALRDQDGRVLRALKTFIYAVAARSNMSLQLRLESRLPEPSPTLQSAPEESF